MPALCGPVAQSAQLVLVFGARAVLQDLQLVESIRKCYPAAHILGCSTAGEICGAEVSDDSLVATAIHFEHTQVRTAQASLCRGNLGWRRGQTEAGSLSKCSRATTKAGSKAPNRPPPFRPMHNSPVEPYPLVNRPS